ncbi:MAG: glucose-1-phosphate cytidylyltransferase [Caulobacterales bacterium]
MKVAILAGGFGTRLSEETTIRPKPMVDVGTNPILWHIMKIYAHHGLNDFVVLGGYKVDFIRNYFLNYTRGSSDFTIDLSSGELVWQRPNAEPWRVTVLDTGQDSMTGGRIKRARDFLGDETFCLTYGDGVTDLNITDLIAFHRRMGKACTVTAVAPPGRFGVLGFDPSGELVTNFREKDQEDVGLINGGFFVCEPAVFDVIDDDSTVWEQEPLNRLVHQGQLASFRHRGFWQSMDTLRDKAVLDKLWDSGKAPWKVWD